MAPNLSRGVPAGTSSLVRACKHGAEHHLTSVISTSKSRATLYQYWASSSVDVQTIDAEAFAKDIPQYCCPAQMYRLGHITEGLLGPSAG